MTAAEKPAYRPALTEKTRIRLLKNDHHEHSRVATLLRALPNPSGQADKQWYDVRFDDGVYGRFLARYLEPIKDGSEESGTRAGDQASAA
jgi:hypothetical protein